MVSITSETLVQSEHSYQPCFQQPAEAVLKSNLTPKSLFQLKTEAKKHLVVFD